MTKNIWTTSLVYQACFSPDGKSILGGGADKNLRLWNLETGKDKLTLEGHTLPVRSICFSCDGKTILSGNEDCTLKMWDTDHGQKLNPER